MIGASSGGSGFFLLIIVAFAVLWFVLVRPQKRRQVAQQQMLSDLKVGDEVLTAGGIYGEITALEENDVLVRIAPGIEVKVSRRAIGGVVSEPEPEPEPEPGPEPAEAAAEAPGEAPGEQPAELPGEEERQGADPTPGR